MCRLDGKKEIRYFDVTFLKKFTMNVNEYSYLIVGGTTKAGTTSLFKYLSEHPDVCPSSLKETRFFLDTDYPLSSAERFSGVNLERYNEFFSDCDDRKLRMEATPDYLYSDLALNIGHLLPNAKIIFILRDPIDRLVSWFKFAKQRGLLDNAVTFEAYIQMQRNLTVTVDTPVHLRALAQGRYKQHIDVFLQKMPDRVLILSFDELKNNPSNVMYKICTFSGIDPKIYKTLIFSIENKSIDVNSQLIVRYYLSVRRRLEFFLHKYKAIIRLLRTPNKLIKKAIGLNGNSTAQVLIEEESHLFLTRYYGSKDE